MGRMSETEKRSCNIPTFIVETFLGDGYLFIRICIHLYLVYTTREPPKMAQFDWFAISGGRHTNKKQ